jgi:hypothetical protein
MANPRPDTMDAETLYIELGRLLESMPNLKARGAIPIDAQRWLARAYALVLASGSEEEATEIKEHSKWIMQDVGRAESVDTVTRTMIFALAVAELKAPSAARGAFIPAGNAFDALTALGRILSSAVSDVLIVDPYMDEKTLTEFALLAAERVTMRLLADEQLHKATLGPAATRWKAQYTATRPLQVRFAPPRTLHDRLIALDNQSVWVLTQSLNAFATRSPASIVRVDPETAALKIAAYRATWDTARPA